MESSLFTHLKIVAVALVASTVMVASAVIVAVAIDALIGDSDGTTASAATEGMVIEAGKPVVYSTRDGSIVR